MKSTPSLSGGASIPAIELPDHLRGLTEKERAYVDARLQGLSPPKAAIAAGYSQSHQGATVERRPRIRKAIDIEFEELRVSAGPELWAGLMKLAQKAGKETVKLDAIRHALDRIGVVPGRVVEVRNTHSLDGLTLPQLYERLAGALAQLPPERRALLAGKLTPVDGPPPAAEAIVDAEATLVRDDAAGAGNSNGQEGDEQPSEPNVGDGGAGLSAAQHLQLQSQLRALGIEPDELPSDADDDAEGLPDNGGNE